MSQKNINKNEQNSDLEIEFDSTEEGLKDNLNKLNKLKEKLKICTKEKQEYLDGWQRERASFANFKTEQEKIKSNFVKFANEKLIIGIISALDSFDMAFSNKESWEKVDKEWRLGVESIYGQFLSVLEQNGVNLIDEIEIFDPKYHQSIELVETEDESNDGKIAEIIQKGYKIGDKILRPVNVKVYKFNKD